MKMWLVFQVGADNGDGDGELSSVFHVFIPNAIQRPTGEVDFPL